MRKKLQALGVGELPFFRNRGGEILRIEAFSDAVFAFAVTLLVVSLEVPKSFEELIEVMRGFPSFAICFSLLILLWYQHYKYFRMFGLEDITVLVLNCALLFVILFYVYPLKFLFGALVHMVLGGHPSVDQRSVTEISAQQMPTLMIVYGIGFASVYCLYGLLYLHAYRKRAQLELDDTEGLVAKGCVQENFLLGGIGLLSIAVALTNSAYSVVASGFVYWLIPIVTMIHGSRTGAKVRASRNH